MRPWGGVAARANSESAYGRGLKRYSIESMPVGTAVDLFGKRREGLLGS